MTTDEPATATSWPTDKQTAHMRARLTQYRELLDEDFNIQTIDLLGQHLDEIRGYHRHGRTCPANCPICGHLAWATAVLQARCDLLTTATAAAEVTA